jgi:hypothetical protein
LLSAARAAGPRMLVLPVCVPRPPHLSGPRRPTGRGCRGHWQWPLTRSDGSQPGHLGNPRRAARGTPIPGPGTAIPGPSPDRIGKRGISRFPIPAESGIGDSLPVSRPNREWGGTGIGDFRVWSSSSIGRSLALSLRRKAGGGRNLHLKDSRQHSAQDRACCTHTRRVSPISRFAANRATGDFPIPRRFRPSRESGIEPWIPSPFPGQIGNRGNGNWGLPGLVSTVTSRARGRPG